MSFEIPVIDGDIITVEPDKYYEFTATEDCRVFFETNDVEFSKNGSVWFTPITETLIPVVEGDTLYISTKKALVTRKLVIIDLTYDIPTGGGGGGSNVTIGESAPIELTPSTVYVGKDNKLDVTNFNASNVYFFNNDQVTFRNDGIYIHPRSIRESFFTIEFDAYVLELNKTMSPSVRITLDVVDLNRTVSDISGDLDSDFYITGRLLNEVTIDLDEDVDNYANFDPDRHLVTTPTDDENAHMTFVPIESPDDAFNYVVTIIAVKSVQQIIIENDENGLFINTSFDINSLLITNVYNEVVKVEAESISNVVNDNILNRREEVIVEDGYDYTDVLDVDYTDIDTDRNINTYVKPIVYKDSIMCLNNSKYIMLFDYDMNDIKNVSLSDYTSNTYRMTESGEHIYFSTDEDDLRLYRVNKEDVYDDGSIDDSIVQYNLENKSDEDPNVNSNSASSNMVFFDGYIFLVDTTKVYIIDLLNETIDYLGDVSSSNYDYISFLVYNDELYIVVDGNSRSIKKIIDNNGTYEIESFMDLDDSPYGCFLIVDGKLISTTDEMVIDLDEKTYWSDSSISGGLDNAIPIVVNNRIYFISRDDAKIADLNPDAIQQTELTYIELPDEVKGDIPTYRYVQTDLGLDYTVEADDTPTTILDSIGAIDHSGKLSYRFITSFPTGATTLTETVSIDKADIYPDTLLTHCYFM